MGDAVMWTRASITGSTAARSAARLPVLLLPGVSSLFEAGGTKGGTLELNLV